MQTAAFGYRENRLMLMASMGDAQRCQIGIETVFT